MLTLLKFEADWCKPCQQMKPVIRELDEADDNLIVKEIDIESNPQTRVEYNVRSVPTLVLLKDRQEIARRVGSGSLSEIKEWIDDQRRGL